MVRTLQGAELSVVVIKSKFMAPAGWMEWICTLKLCHFHVITCSRYTHVISHGQLSKKKYLMLAVGRLHSGVFVIPSLRALTEEKRLQFFNRLIERD